MLGKYKKGAVKGATLVASLHLYHKALCTFHFNRFAAKRYPLRHQIIQHHIQLPHARHAIVIARKRQADIISVGDAARYFDNRDRFYGWLCTGLCLHGANGKEK